MDMEGKGSTDMVKRFWVPNSVRENKIEYVGVEKAGR